MGGFVLGILVGVEFDQFQSPNTVINEAQKKLKNLPRVVQLLSEKKKWKSYLLALFDAVCLPLVSGAVSEQISKKYNCYRRKAFLQNPCELLLMLYLNTEGLVCVDWADAVGCRKLGRAGEKPNEKHSTSFLFWRAKELVLRTSFNEQVSR